MRKIKGIILSAGIFIATSSCIPDFFKQFNCSQQVSQTWVEQGALQKVCALRLENVLGNVSLQDSFITEGYFHDEKEQPTNYSAFLFGSSNNPIYKLGFNFPNIIITEDNPFPLPQLISQRTIYLPFRGGSQRVEIYNALCDKIINLETKNIRRL